MKDKKKLPPLKKFWLDERLGGQRLSCREMIELAKLVPPENWDFHDEVFSGEVLGCVVKIGPRSICVELPDYDIGGRGCNLGFYFDQYPDWELQSLYQHLADAHKIKLQGFLADALRDSLTKLKEIRGAIIRKD